MNFLSIFISVALLGVSSAAYARAYDNVAIYSTEKANGSASFGASSVYTKTFDIILSNLTDNEVDLSKVCLKAYAPGNKELRLDTIDEALVSGILKKGQPVKGVAIFSSQDDAISKATLVKLSDNCNFVRISH